MSQVTKRALEQSLKNQLLKKPLNKITVSDIAAQGARYKDAIQQRYENRHKRGITQEELAEYIVVSKAAVSKWEIGVSHS